MKRFLFILSFLALVPTLYAAAPFIVKPLPQLTVEFAADVIAYLFDELAALRALKEGPFVSLGGIGPTSGTLAHTIEALNGAVHGYYVSQAATAHTYTASRRTFVYADSLEVRTITATGGTGCTFQSRNLRLVFVECSTGSIRPSLSTELLPLFYVDTDADNITAVSDTRPTNPQRPNVVNLRDPLIGAKCDGVTNDVVAFQKAIAVAQPVHRRVEIPADANCLIASQISLKPEVDIVGHGRDSSVITVSGTSVRGLVFDQGAFTHAAMNLKGFRVIGSGATGDLISIINASLVHIEDVEVLNSGAKGINLQNSVSVSLEKVFVQNYTTDGIHIAATNSFDLRSVDVVGAGVAGTNAVHCELSSFGKLTNVNLEGLDNALNGIRFNACGNVALRDSYIELFLTRAIVFSGAASRQVTIENNHINAQTDPLIDATSGALVHKNLRIISNTLVGFGGGPEGAVVEAFSPGSTLTFAYQQNEFGGSTMTTHVVGFQESDVVKLPVNDPGPGQGFYADGVLFANGIGIGNMTRQINIPSGDILNVESAPVGGVVRLRTETRDNDFKFAEVSLLGGGLRVVMEGVAGTLVFKETAADCTVPAANGACLFSKDNGAGKTQLCARFNTGAVQCFATEP